MVDDGVGAGTQLVQHLIERLHLLEPERVRSMRAAAALVLPPPPPPSSSPPHPAAARKGVTSSRPASMTITTTSSATGSKQRGGGGGGSSSTHGNREPRPARQTRAGRGGGVLPGHVSEESVTRIHTRGEEKQEAPTDQQSRQTNRGACTS